MDIKILGEPYWGLANGILNSEMDLISGGPKSGILLHIEAK